MHLIIYFSGTDDDGSHKSGYPNHFHYPHPEKTKTIIVKGCQDKHVCNSVVFPNLAAFAKRFVTTLFSITTDKQLTLSTPELHLLQIGIHEYTATESTDNAISAITLAGYSRGAVTCFNVAKELNKIAPQIPVNIVANQPVPGNIYQLPGSNAAAVADCSHLTNLRNVSIILGSYTGEPIPKGMPRWLHRLGYSQIVPKLPHRQTCKRNIIVIHRRHHTEPVLPIDESCGTEHLHVEVAKILQQENSLDNNKMPDIDLSTNYVYRMNMPHPTQLQTFFGMKRSVAYQHLDSAMPQPHLCEGMKKLARESFTSWWQKQEKYASWFSSPLTKQLVQQIKITDKTPNDIAALKQLYHQTEQWLALKNGTKTSRYYQVTALRDNLLLHLKALHVPLREIFIEHYDKMHEGRYLLKEWLQLSTQASGFRSLQTKKLDTAFKNHSDPRQEARTSEQNDRCLLMALKQWLANKEGGKSKRYELVCHFRDRLEKMIEKRYEVSKRIQLTNSG